MRVLGATVVEVMQIKRIEVCGGIAAGKTTLVLGLCDAGFSPIYERFRDTQFYKAFYEDPAAYAFEAEIDFLLQHYHMVKRERHQPNLICDYSLWLDHAYASTNLVGSRHRAFSIVWEEILSEIGYPALVINVKCQAETLIGRIACRERPEEDSISIEYLSKLNTNIEQQMALLAAKIPILDVDSKHINFTPPAPESKSILARIRTTVSELLNSGNVGRHAF
ncbi:MAG: deoxynucleoside kinase [Alphaproteobacteria bacterium]|nr:deoxynucleoside kinase [Alphaproteobacteria bacterium]